MNLLNLLAALCMLSLVFAVSACFPLYAETNKDQISMLQLDNGMKVLVKTIDSKDEDVTIRFVANGGYASYSKKLRASIELSPSVALHSKVGPYDYDQLQSYFYGHSIDLNVNVQPFSRVIDGVSDPRNIEQFLRIINLYFTKCQLTEEAYRSVVEKAKKQVTYRERLGCSNFEDNCRAFNTQNYPPTTKIGIEEINKASLTISEKYFREVFVNPSDYTCIIVGNVTLKSIEKAIFKYLGEIPPLTKIDNPMPIKKIGLPSFPEGVKTSRFKIAKKVDSKHTTVMTFPLKIKLTKDLICETELAVQLMGRYLIDAVGERLKQPIEFQVELQYPFYPLLDQAWVSVKYIVHENHVAAAGQMILVQIGNLQKNGVIQQQVDHLVQKKLARHELWKNDPSYWDLELSDRSLKGLDLNGIGVDVHEGVSVQGVNAVLKNFISLNNYTIVTFSLNP